ncbi:hypothetical protein [Kozakia baliensis]|uniref:hypothetical protein n=1 Tax=Kozakia baliensis TaxID=153496 RepID=UPI00087BBA54|nr:hypothetical protein [Kozakia baliensis]AOX19235.1 hypothetical protein A0U90_01820 [Kozakia baliensis]
MKTLSLDPTALPPLDIIDLANSGVIVRAERETPPDGIPAFVTAQGWQELLQRYADGNSDIAPRVLAALEQAIKRLLDHAATSFAQSTHNEIAPILSCPSDLFASNGTIQIAFVRDRQHPVACVLIGTVEQLRELIKNPPPKPS